jgi:hypothetical protein
MKTDVTPVVQHTAADNGPADLVAERTDVARTGLGYLSILCQELANSLPQRLPIIIIEFASRFS